jgi:type VI secretion system protein ImpM
MVGVIAGCVSLPACVTVVPMSVTSAQSAGFFGKIPSRGDFVAAGLAAPVVKSWDRFVSAALAASKAALNDRWSDIWLEAPVWRFALPEEMCGRDPLLGLWMPSVDKAGRHFPLMIATVCAGATPEQMARQGTAWLDAAEAAGRAAIADDLSPEQVTAHVPSPPALAVTSDTGLPFGLLVRPGAGLWWTEGAPLVPAHGLVLEVMPDATIFVAMLDAGQASS